MKPRLTYANVMSTLAVFLVLGGGAAIAAKSILPKNSVGTQQLRRGSVRTPDIRNQAVTLRKIAASARKALRGQRGPEGPIGPAGPLGPVVIRFVEIEVEPNFISGQRAASCNPGERAVGGGVGFTSSPGSGDAILYSAPGDGEGPVEQGETPTVWEANILNSEGSKKTARIYAVCAR